MAVPFLHLICSISFLFFPTIIITAKASCSSLCPRQFFQQANRVFEQKAERFFVFSEEDDTWIEVNLPDDLKRKRKSGEEEVLDEKEVVEILLPQRKRLSLTKLSSSSVWVTGESGSIYERFWNGLQWVIAPHELPLHAGRAVSVFVINHTILALSEAGLLYQVLIIIYYRPKKKPFIITFGVTSISFLFFFNYFFFLSFG